MDNVEFRAVMKDGPIEQQPIIERRIEDDPEFESELDSDPELKCFVRQSSFLLYRRLQGVRNAIAESRFDRERIRCRECANGLLCIEEHQFERLA